MWPIGSLCRNEPLSPALFFISALSFTEGKKQTNDTDSLLFPSCFLLSSSSHVWKINSQVKSLGSQVSNKSSPHFCDWSPVWVQVSSLKSTALLMEWELMVGSEFLIHVVWYSKPLDVYNIPTQMFQSLWLIRPLLTSVWVRTDCHSVTTPSLSCDFCGIILMSGICLF